MILALPAVPAHLLNLLVSACEVCDIAGAGALGVRYRFFSADRPQETQCAVVSAVRNVPGRSSSDHGLSVARPEIHL